MKDSQVLNGRTVEREDIYAVHGKLALRESLKQYRIRGRFLGLSLEDVQSMGMIGLMKAFHKFDDTYGVRFSTYAVPLIRGEIQRYFRDYSPGVRYSRQTKELAVLLNDLDVRNMTVEEIAEVTQSPRARVIEAIDYRRHYRPKSFSEEVPGANEGDENGTYEDITGTGDDETQFFVEDFIATLPARSQDILRRMMLGETQAEIGKVHHISQAHVCRIREQIQTAYTNFDQGIKPAKKRPNGQGDLKRAKELVRLGQHKRVEIAAMTGTNVATLNRYAHDLRKKERRMALTEAVASP